MQSEATRHVDEIRQLNAAARKAFEACQRRMDGMETLGVNMNQDMREVRGSIARIEDRLEKVIDILRNGAEVQEQQQEQQQQASRNQQQQLAQLRQARHANAVERRERLHEELTGVAASVNDVIRASARMPAMSTSIPKTFRSLSSAWARFGLSEFEDANKRNWTDHRIHQAYDKYHYLYKYMQEQNRNNVGETMQQTIDRLDRERGTMTLASYFRHLKARDPSVVPRSKNVRHHNRNRNHNPLPPTRPTATRTSLSEAAIRQHQRRMNAMRTTNVGRSFGGGRDQLMQQAHLQQLAATRPPERFVANAEGEIDGVPNRRIPGQRRGASTDAAGEFAREIDKFMGDGGGERFNMRTSGGRHRLV